jgi:tetratricopeptide (TPR) repeat protein
MDLAEQLLEQMADASLTPTESARLHVKLSRALEESGDLEGARAAMGDLWSGVGARPAVEGMERGAAAEVLLQAGVLTSGLGSAKQVEGAQETAKDLISEAAAIFDALGDVEKTAEAQSDLAVCYWRQGEFDGARAWLREALSRLPDDSEVKAVALIRSAIVETVANRLGEALRVYTDAAPFFERVGNHALRGKFHVGFALALKNFGQAERREDYIDRALMEFTAAGYHFEQAGHARYCARVENNLAMLFIEAGRPGEAHEHAMRARKIFAKLGDGGSVAQVDETLARVLLAVGRNAEAEGAARGAVRALERGDELSLLAEALTTHGTALARTGRFPDALAALRRAAEVAERAGDREGAGRAALATVEEAGAHLSPGELYDAYTRADDFLGKTQHPGTIARLNACARRAVTALAGSGSRASATRGDADAVVFGLPPDWEGFNFKEEVRHFESLLIERALKDAGGSVTHAARLLGLKHHHSLSSILKGRHNDLLGARTPAQSRRRSIFRTTQKH